ncbi:hypothetical protein EDD15DRAFT_2266488, partial [Pisolithus albus]
IYWRWSFPFVLLSEYSRACHLAIRVQPTPRNQNHFSSSELPREYQIYDGTHVPSGISASHTSYIEWRVPWSFLSWNVGSLNHGSFTFLRGVGAYVSDMNPPATHAAPRFEPHRVSFSRKGIDRPFEIACDFHGHRFCCLPPERLQLRCFPIYIIFAVKDWPAFQQLHKLDGYGIFSFLSTHKTLHISVTPRVLV